MSKRREFDTLKIVYTHKILIVQHCQCILVKYIYFIKFLIYTYVYIAYDFIVPKIELIL